MVSQKSYRGRFAPSPTGPLHFGSLVAALASYLEARCQGGEWLVRMEDVDELRTIEGANSSILTSLEQHGLYWDGEVLYQTRRKTLYQAVLEQLQVQERVYACDCSRRQLHQTAPLGPYGHIYPGTCRSRKLIDRPGESALRMIVTDTNIQFCDQVMGRYGQNMASDIGDFIIRRRDGLFAYQLAVVADDHDQGITHVVRGSDLLDSTPRQIYLQQCLDYTQPHYAHLPVAVNPAGDKLSKQTGALALDNKLASTNLLKALRFLGQQPEAALLDASPEEILAWAIDHWQLHNVPDREKLLPA